MAAKYQLITELYRRTGVAVAKNPQAWQGFLSSACRNYKCRFDEQLLIYAQRPDAVAVVKLETWNRQFKRWVNKDSKGIAVFDPKGRRNTLKYYFDVSDTHEGYYGSRPVPIWQMDERYEQAVMERLSDRFGDVESTDLASALMETAKNAVEDNLQDYFSQLKDCTKDSFLEELDDFNIEVIYRRLAANSVAFMLISRCGLDTNEFFDREDFADILNFNTPATINAIGIATSDIAEMALREISQSIRNVQMAEKDQNRTFAQRTQAQYDKGRQQPERSEYNERNHLQQTGGLSYSRPNITERARASAWQVRFDAQGLSGEAQTSDLSQPADIGQAERASARGRADSTPEVGASDKAALSRAGRDRGTERESSDAVGRTDEQHPQPSGGSDTDRTDLQVSVAKDDEIRVNLPTVDEQIEMIAKAEDEKASAFAISKEDIDSVLQKGSGVADGKYRIYRQFQKGEDRQKNIEFLKNEYGTGGGTHIFPDGFRGHSWHDSKGLAINRNGTYTNHDLVLKWSQVEKRLRELIKDNRYLNPKEKDHYADYLESVSAPQYEIDTQRKIARQRFIDAHRDLPPADKRDTLALRLSDFIRDLDRYEKDLLSVVERSDLADVTAEQMEQHLSDPSTVQQLIDFLAQVQWKTTSVFSRSNGWKFTEELRELHPLCYLYNEGDVVYIGADKYEIATLTEEKVYLQNAEFPILGQEYSRADFEEKLTENPANDHLKVVVTEKQRTETPSEKKQDGIQFSIGFSEHPAFYDRQLNDRYTNLSFALGNKLLGILDEKQHREREGDKNIGWYHKTDFVIKTVIGGEKFKYEGRFDIGDGEGDLIAHIKNFYDYALSPKGEQLYGDDRESLLRGRDEFIPFLEQHTELTQEDEKLLDEIMATESDWYRTAEEAEEKPQAYADKLNGSEAPAIETEQSTDDLIGRGIIIDNRKYLIESIGKISGDVSLRDITFQDNVGFPINRVEKIEYIQKLLEQEKTELPPEEKTEAPATDRHNFRITDDAIGVGGAKEKFRNNMAAINLLHELEIENRLATPEEQEVLSRYVGWGGLSMAFDEHNAAWAEEFKELYASLSPEEYRAAMESTLTAFYTPPVVIKAMYDTLDRLGFSQGNILEPSCGTGNFFGLLPESMQNSKLHGVEIDSLTGRIAKQLYQKANIAIEGFEKTNLPDDHFDVVLGNVPFGEIRVNDSRYNAQKFLIHDYFFAKALDKVRAGGVVMFITSKGTMDKASPEVRKYIAQRAELLGAIRLPNNTFKANAGTEVTSDILILQKRDRVMDIEPDWVHLDTDENGVTMNRYFVEHPEMVLGEIKMESTRFGTFEPVCKARKDIPLSELLSNAVQRINGEIPELDNGVDEISDEQELSVHADPNVRNFSFTLVDGRVYFRENDRMQPASVSMTAENRIKGLIQIRDCVRKLIEYQTEDYPEEMIRTEQENLNRLYDVYTAKYGLINSRGNYLAFASDESYFLLCSLEVLDDEGNFKRKADMFTKRTIKPHREVTSVETASEALALSIGEKARVDLPYMEQLTGKTQAELVQDLQGVIFKVPNCEPVSYVAADEYLSGNVRNKLTVAGLAAKNNAELAVNVDALRKVIPKDLSAAEISVRLGATWIPQEDIQRFVMELLTPSSYAAGRLKVRYTPINGDWFIENKSSDMGNVKADSTYGTKRASAYRIIEDTLNLRDTRIFDYVYDEHGNKKAVFNAKETTAAQAKQEAIKQAFQDWIWKDPERRNRLVRYYNDTFNSVRPREYDGSHITFGGISPEITLRPHQVNAIAHILYGGNTLLAHKVGAGKTFEMVAAAQESKRLGLCQKSMFVVPNHLVGQWASEYLRLYPSANILVTTKQDFETGNRKKFCGRIATGDYDAVIIGHSQFEKIPMSIERQREQLEKQLDDIERGIDDVQASKGEQFTVKQLMKTRKAIKTKLEKLNDTKRKDTVIDFEQLGVDRLFIDESHFYKNLYLYTKMRNVGGIAQTEAQKSSDLFMKCRYLDEITGNRGTVFATGTPVSNSMVELYSVQRYLQYDTLAQNGLQHFDSWASTFGETVTALELAPEGTNYRAKTRFAKFYNLPELMQMFREVADIQTADMLKLPVPKVNYHNIKTKPSDIQTEMVASLAKRAEKVRARLVEPNIDNMLKITNDGRKLALDQRMIDPMLPDEPESKVNTCVDNVYRIWEEHADTKATQLVFCDLSTPKNDGTFNVYDDMREKLIARGIPAEQIRFIHEATTDAQKKELFGKVRSGEVRVLFGSTPKMGAGTNVQDRLIAIHNLDCPWRPSDLEQRQGRIERQGNMFPEVEVYRYVTEQTFDAYLYQLVESKQKFISQIMTSKSPVRSAEDVDEVALSFAEVKMLATGDARFKEKMDLDIQVSKLRVLKQSYLSEHYDLEDRVLKYYPQTIKEYEERIAGYENDAALAEQHKPQGEDKFCPMTLKGVTYTEKADAGEMLLAICKDYPMSAATEIGSYRGFRIEIYYDTVNAHYCMNLCGKAKHKVDLGSDALGNLTRIENELSKLPARLEAAKTKKAETIAQLETAKEEIKKPFAFEDELKEKTERLNALNIELNLNEKDTSVMDTEPEQTEEQPERKCASRER
ncbi:TPA: DEAD/DEAH box helicase family protein [Clostridioides difficile]|nr:DEAD/DEAH box helicase family protein [Clostridioides difficile]HBH1356887.1 DEAD/DEAH box helicase family protein [Clostridioides difficile]HBH1413672.1 DEAD/DEAH box helicase family protein [Clostridioides difficile]HBH1526025.1 DEAD/DEAH box helicase family protein [Clostridioides difficile]HBH1558220.1 DEAD/DEAH box helicase family protein [Clostridioides difficile]